MHAHLNPDEPYFGISGDNRVTSKLANTATERYLKHNYKQNTTSIFKIHETMLKTIETWLVDNNGKFVLTLPKLLFVLC